MIRQKPRRTMFQKTLFLILFIASSYTVSPSFAKETSPELQSDVPTYKKNIFCVLDVGKDPVNDIFIDSKENCWVLRIKNNNADIQVFDRTGKKIKKTKWACPYPKFNARINVDELGNILLFDTQNHKAFILGPSEKLIGNFEVGEFFEYWFSNGCVYQVTDGKILYRLPGSNSAPKQKIYYKDFDERFDIDKAREETQKEITDRKYVYRPLNHHYLPDRVGNFELSGLQTITDDETSFGEYFCPNVPGYDFQNPKTETLKFDPTHRLVGIIPSEFIVPFVNLESDTAYEIYWSEDDVSKTGRIKIYRWDNPKQ